MRHLIWTTPILALALCGCTSLRDPSPVGHDQAQAAGTVSALLDPRLGAMELDGRRASFSESLRLRVPIIGPLLTMPWHAYLGVMGRTENQYAYERELDAPWGGHHRDMAEYLAGIGQLEPEVLALLEAGANASKPEPEWYWERLSSREIIPTYSDLLWVRERTRAGEISGEDFQAYCRWAVQVLPPQAMSPEILDFLREEDVISDQKKRQLLTLRFWRLYDSVLDGLLFRAEQRRIDTKEWKARWDAEKTVVTAFLEKSGIEP
ncbi:MAG: hypothetical protein KAI66_03715 [Lentisphaeria bacterium]|nr:hypothetical protein [Lentisphaeria bacterium]